LREQALPLDQFSSFSEEIVLSGKPTNPASSAPIKSDNHQRDFYDLTLISDGGAPAIGPIRFSLTTSCWLEDFGFRMRPVTVVLVVSWTSLTTHNIVTPLFRSALVEPRLRSGALKPFGVVPVTQI